MIKVVLIDDSSFMRKVIKDVLTQNNIEVIAEAENGFVGLKHVVELKPDVVLLDIEMPVLTGIDTLSLIMKKMPTAVIMFSSLTKEGANVTMEALRLGAVDFLQKPKNSIEIYSLKDTLVEKVKTAANAKVENTKVEKEKSNLSIHKKTEKVAISKSYRTGAANKLCVIGCSTGGPKALTQLLGNITNMKESILIVQHMPAFFTKTLAKRLDDITPYIVKEAEDNEVITKGVAYIAPGDYHMEIKKQGDKLMISLNQKPSIHGCRPAVDYLFKSAAPIVKEKLLGCVLTGMGKDGLDGSRNIKEYGGKIYVESEETCTIYGMPKQIVENKLEDKILPIDAFSKEISEFLS